MTDQELKQWTGKHLIITSIVTFPLLVIYLLMLIVGALIVLIHQVWECVTE